MNELTHFLTGYAIARGMKYEHDRFEAFFLAAAAMTPDLDALVGVVWSGFQHAVFSHTILGGLLFALAFLLVTLVILRGFLARLDIRFTRLLLLTLIGLASHLLCDIVTFQDEDCAMTLAHLYFWPVWNQSFHLNCLFPGVTRPVRVIAEVVYSAFLVVLVVFYDWAAKKHNPFHVFNPRRWWTHAKDLQPPEKVPKAPYVYLILFAVVEAICIRGYFF